MTAGNLLNGNHVESHMSSQSSDATVGRPRAHDGGPFRCHGSSPNANIVDDDDALHVLPSVEGFFSSRPSPVSPTSLAHMPAVAAHIKVEGGGAHPVPETPRHPPSSPAVVPASPPTNSSNGSGPARLPVWTIYQEARARSGLPPMRCHISSYERPAAVLEGAAPIARPKCFVAGFISPRAAWTRRTQCMRRCWHSRAAQRPCRHRRVAFAGLARISWERPGPPPATRHRVPRPCGSWRHLRPCASARG